MPKLLNWALLGTWENYFIVGPILLLWLIVLAALFPESSSTETTE